MSSLLITGRVESRLLIRLAPIAANVDPPEPVPDPRDRKLGVMLFFLSCTDIFNIGSEILTVTAGFNVSRCSQDPDDGAVNVLLYFDIFSFLVRSLEFRHVKHEIFIQF